MAGERHGPSLPALIAWIGWAVLGVMAIGAAVHGGSNVPVGQDWPLVPVVTGHEPEPVHWLWHQDGNDRHPVGRALTLATIAITRDFRAPAVVAVAALILLSALLLRAAHRVRGRARWSDAFFPAILLQPALDGGLSPSALLSATVPLMLAGAILLAVLSDPVLRTRRWSVLTALAMVTLPLTGLAGILVAAAAAPWVAACGWRHWPPRDPSVPVDAGPALLSFIFVAIVVTGMIFSDYDFSGWSDPALDRGLLVFRTGSALAGAFGPVAAERWQLVAATLVGLVLVTSVMLLVAGYRLQEIERYRALGLACMLAAAGLAVMMSAWQFAVLLLAVVYYVWELYGRPMVTVALEAGLLAGALAVIPANLRYAAVQRSEAEARLGALERDMAAGVSRSELAQRYWPWLMPEGSVADLSAGMGMVAESKIGPLARLRN
jgi:hypothetical protein